MGDFIKFMILIYDLRFMIFWKIRIWIYIVVSVGVLFLIECFLG